MPEPKSTPTQHDPPGQRDKTPVKVTKAPGPYATPPSTPMSSVDIPAVELAGVICSVSLDHRNITVLGRGADSVVAAIRKLNVVGGPAVFTSDYVEAPGNKPGIEPRDDRARQCDLSICLGPEELTGVDTLQHTLRSLKSHTGVCASVLVKINREQTWHSTLLRYREVARLAGMCLTEVNGIQLDEDFPFTYVDALASHTALSRRIAGSMTDLDPKLQCEIKGSIRKVWLLATTARRKTRAGDHAACSKQLHDFMNGSNHLFATFR